MNRFLHLFVLSLCVLVGSVSAWGDDDRDDTGRYRRNDDRATATIAGDFFGAGASPRTDGLIKGDAFIAGGEVVLSAPVMGDALLSGGRIHVGDRIGSDLYAGGGSIVVAADVGHNARLAGGRIHLTADADIAGNTTLAGSTLLMEGRTGGAFAAFGESVVINGQINGGAAVVARSLEVGPDARINGRLTYRTATPPKISPAAVISGGLKESEIAFPEAEIAPVAKAVAWAGALMFSVGLFVIGALIILSAPGIAASVVAQIRSRPLGVLLAGLALIVCMPVAAILAMISVIGIPIGLLLMFLWPVVVMIGYLAGALFLGDSLAALFSRGAARSGNGGLRILGLAIVLVMALLLTQIPLLGVTLIVALLLFGTGALAFGARELL